MTTGERRGRVSGRAMIESCVGVEQALHQLVAAGRQRDDRAAARLDLLDVAQHLLEHVIARRDRHHRHLLVDERDRAVLHLAGRVALGVDVRDLLQLERALERDRVVDAAAEEQEVVPVVEPPGDLVHQRRHAQRLLDQRRQLQQAVDFVARLLRREDAAHLGEVQREQVQRRRAAT